MPVAHASEARHEAAAVDEWHGRIRDVREVLQRRHRPGIRAL
jgi:hypothetical protein